MATHFSSLPEEINLNVYMFSDDIHLAIMPIGGQTKNHKTLSVDLKGEYSECEKAQSIISQLCEYGRDDIPRMLCDAVDQIARHLSWEGQAVYEIIEDGDEIYIRGFTSRNLFRIFSWYLQIIPPKNWDLWKRKYTLVNRKKIWSLQIPHTLGGKSEYGKILRKLRKYQHFGPEFYSEDLKHGKIVKNYDFPRYIKNNEIYVNKVTNKWGWNRRDLSQDKCTEFYTLYKRLSFIWAQAILREHIINEINQLLTRLSINCKIIVTGLPTAAETLQVRSDMQNGTINFSEALDRVET